MRSLLLFRLTSDSASRTIETALRSNADGVVIELASSDPLGKDRCLAALAAARSRTAPGEVSPRLYISVSARPADMTNDELTQILSVLPDGLFITHCETGKDMTAMDVRLSAAESIAGTTIGTTQIIAEVTDTASAIFGLQSYRGASPRLAALVWDADQLARAIGALSARDDKAELISPCRTARDLCLIGAAAAGVFAIDTACSDIKDPTALKREAERAKQDGFLGKVATDEQQAALFNEIFQSEET